MDQGVKYPSSEPSFVSLSGNRRFSDSLNPDPGSSSQTGEIIHVGPAEFLSITGGKFSSNDDFGLKSSSFSGSDSDRSSVSLKVGVSMEPDFMTRLDGGFRFDEKDYSLSYCFDKYLSIRYSSIPEPSFPSAPPTDGDGYRIVNEFSSGDDSKLYTPSSFRNIDGNSTLLETDEETTTRYAWSRAETILKL